MPVRYRSRTVKKETLQTVSLLTPHVEPGASEDLETDLVDHRARELELRTRDDELGMVDPVEQADRVRPARRLAVAHARDQIPELFDDRRLFGEHVFLSESFAHPAHAANPARGV